MNAFTLLYSTIFLLMLSPLSQNSLGHQSLSLSLFLSQLTLPHKKSCLFQPQHRWCHSVLQRVYIACVACGAHKPSILVLPLCLIHVHQVFLYTIFDLLTYSKAWFVFDPRPVCNNYLSLVFNQNQSVLSTLELY